ncbi:TlyA family RNA methyltransferase [Clostridium sp. DL1XJH146]
MGTVKKERLDVLLVNNKLFDSREKAKVSIMAGEIYVNGNREDKCGTKIPADAEIVFKGKKMKYVSRGGFKLEKAINSFDIELKDKVCADIGASTGGFTDCMLQNGASKVYSIDVGYGQIAWKLRTDDRVTVLERTNARYLKIENIGETIDFASIDVSFISLTKIIPTLLNLINSEGEVVALIKPQFEAGRDKIGKKGVVKDTKVHIEVIEKIVNFVIQQNCEIKGIQFSPIKGPEGNIEYLVYFHKINENNNKDFNRTEIDKIVKIAHEKAN